MKKLDPEKFRGAMEAILADKQKKQPANPAPVPQPSRTVMPASEFEELMAKRRGVN